MERRRPHLRRIVTMPFGLQILVAEDNPDCALSLAGLLRLCGHQRVQVVSDGASALATVETGVIDVVLLDLGLPVLNGWEVARRIRTMPLPKRPLIVAITGYGWPEDSQRSADAGIDFHLLKPTNPQDVLDLLQTIATKDPSNYSDACLAPTT
jgi:CheY-like chemotaxis protein